MNHLGVISWLWGVLSFNTQEMQMKQKMAKSPFISIFVSSIYSLEMSPLTFKVSKLSLVQRYQIRTFLDLEWLILKNGGPSILLTLTTWKYTKKSPWSWQSRGTLATTNQKFWKRQLKNLNKLLGILFSKQVNKLSMRFKVFLYDTFKQLF